MKMLKGKGKAGIAGKWLGYLIIAYLLASWGVNGVIHPLHYFRNAVMHQKFLEISEGTDGLVIERPQDAEGMKMGFLSFQVEAKNYDFELPLYGYAGGKDAGEIRLKAWKGWNCVDLSRFLWPGEVWEKVVIPQAAVESGGIVLTNAVLSEYRKVDTGGMVSVWVSFLLLLVFWEGVWWMKERYAE